MAKKKDENKPEVLNLEPRDVDIVAGFSRREYLTIYKALKIAEASMASVQEVTEHDHYLLDDIRTQIHEFESFISSGFKSNK